MVRVSPGVAEEADDGGDDQPATDEVRDPGADGLYEVPGKPGLVVR